MKLFGSIAIVLGLSGLFVTDIILNERYIEKYWYSADDPTNPRRGDIEFGERIEDPRWGFTTRPTKPQYKPHLYNPQYSGNGPILRNKWHVNQFGIAERWVERYNKVTGQWNKQYIDLVPKAIEFDKSYYSSNMNLLRSNVHPEYRHLDGTGQGTGGLSPYKYDENGVKRPWWHKPYVDPILNPWR